VTRWLVVIALLYGADAAGEPLRILFIGNSLTAWNDLPAIVQSLAVAGGHDRPVIQSITRGGFSLEDHWNEGEAQRVMTGARWNVVVLQQGPSALVDSRRLLVAYARRFAGVIRRAGAIPALYMVWPSMDRRFDYAGVSASYTAAARAVNGTLFAAGDIWRSVLSTYPDIRLYSDDGLHPTLAGSYLAALVIYRGVYKSQSLALPALGIPDLDARRLQSAVLALRN
jgi:hypothetical protein